MHAVARKDDVCQRDGALIAPGAQLVAQCLEHRRDHAPPVSDRVESRLGSQPCITARPRSRKAIDRFDEIVLLPIPPLPYMAICRIHHLAL